MSYLIILLAISGWVWWSQEKKAEFGIRPFDYFGRQVTLSALRHQYQGARYGELVFEHVKQRTEESMETELTALITLLPPFIHPLWSSMLNEYISRTEDQRLLHQDCSDVFWEICTSFKGRAKAHSCQATDMMAMVMFQSITTCVALVIRQSESGTLKRRADEFIEDISQL